METAEDVWRQHISLFNEVAVSYSLSVAPQLATVHGTVVTVTLNFDRLQTSCLGEGSVGGGGGGGGESGAEVVAKTTEKRHPFSFHSRTDTYSNPTSLSLCQKNNSS